MWGMAEMASFVMFQVSRDFAAMSYIAIGVIIAERGDWRFGAKKH